jgi:hypothetical protein
MMDTSKYSIEIVDTFSSINITNGLEVLGGELLVRSEQQSLNSSNGAIICYGGAGIDKDLNVGGNLNILGTTNTGLITLGTNSTIDLKVNASLNSNLIPKVNAGTTSTNIQDIGSITRYFNNVYSTKIQGDNELLVHKPGSLTKVLGKFKVDETSIFLGSITANNCNIDTGVNANDIGFKVQGSGIVNFNSNKFVSRFNEIDFDTIDSTGQINIGTATGSTINLSSTMSNLNIFGHVNVANSIVSSSITAGTIEISNNSLTGIDYQHSVVGSFTTLYGSANKLTDISVLTISEEDTNVTVSDSGSNGLITFTTENLERARIGANGYMGLGTNNPSQLLEVKNGSGLIHSLTDGVSILETGTFTGLRVLSSTTITDGTTTLTGGNITSVNGTFSDSVNIQQGLVVGGVSTMTGGLGINGNLSGNEKLYVNGDARITGLLKVNGSITVVHTDNTTTEQISVTNDGTGPALIVTQTGSQPIAKFSDENGTSVIIGDGGLTGFGGITTPVHQVDIQSTLTGGSASIPVQIAQSDADTGMIKLKGTSVSSNIAKSLVVDGSTVTKAEIKGYLRVNVDDTTNQLDGNYYIPLYTLD